MKKFFVYILASKRNGSLYIGSTLDIIKRVWQHKNKIIKGFTEKYDVHQLVYYEIHQTIDEAVKREKRLKNWCKKWKLNLIEKFNLSWQDLYESIIV